VLLSLVSSTALAAYPIDASTLSFAGACVESRQRRWQAQHQKSKCEGQLTTMAKSGDARIELISPSTQYSRQNHFFLALSFSPNNPAKIRAHGVANFRRFLNTGFTPEISLERRSVEGRGSVLAATFGHSQAVVRSSFRNAKRSRP
jgi:hypothetical protein